MAEGERRLTEKDIVFGAVRKVLDTEEPVSFSLEGTMFVIDKKLKVGREDPTQKLSEKSNSALHRAANMIEEFQKTALGQKTST